MARLAAPLPPAARPSLPRVSAGPLAQFAELAGALEGAAAAIARLDARLAGHPLVPAWLWRIRLESVRRHAAADGRLIDPWHLAAIIEGARFRMDRGAEIIDRGAIFAAARHALELWRWFARPDDAQAEAIGSAEAALPASEQAPPLLGAALAVHAWLDRGGERPALRAALARYWQRRGMLRVVCPLLTGNKALGGETPWQVESWTVAFLAALAEEAEAGGELLQLLEREWFAARAAVCGRRRDSHVAAAVDIMAAAPVVSATTLAQSLGIAVKNAAALLDGFVERGIAIEVTHRSKRRLYGLRHLAPLREETAPSKRPIPGRSRGRPPGRASGPMVVDESAQVRDTTPPLTERLVLTPLERREFDFSDLDRWMREADQQIRRTKAVLDQMAAAARVVEAGSDGC
jgi:hypothetical protein